MTPASGVGGDVPFRGGPAFPEERVEKSKNGSRGPAIAVRGLRFSYDGREVLSGLDFTVPWGAVVAYLGPNGAGKSTTLRTLVGLLRPAAGEVRVDGEDPADDDLQARRKLGYVPDTGGLYPLLSPREHLALIADLHELPETAAAARQAELAERFGMEEFLDQRIDTLSKGQRQRVALAAGLLHQPRILMLDEPLSGLDAHAARVLRDLVREHADAGGAVLYCSHVLDVVERVCDSAVVLVGGRIVADAPVPALLTQTKKKTLEAAFHALTGREGA